ncbi:MAG: nucleoside deaminase [Candidatus Micrarchaeaceae archaeon]|jgi:tRNA(Arg) A34 adenosine deaminase TadA
MDHEKFMLKALEEAKRGMKGGQMPYAGCIVKGNKIIGLGHNTVHIGEAKGNNDVVAHGEINTIRSACKKMKAKKLHNGLSGLTLYSTCEPCPMCFGACKWSGIKNIIYGISLKELTKIQAGKKIADTKQIKYEKDGIDVFGGVLKKECEALFIKYY